MNMDSARVQNSQAMHDWHRAIRDLEGACSGRAPEALIDDLRVTVDLAAARVRSLSGRAPVA
jgi:hypothetical protein